MLESLFNKFYKKETPTQVFRCGYCDIFKNSFFYRTPPVAASDYLIIYNQYILDTYISVYKYIQAVTAWIKFCSACFFYL